MSFILSKVIKVESKPSVKSVIFDTIVDSYPVMISFEYVARCKNGKVGSIKVTNLDNKKDIFIKPHQCSVFDRIEYQSFDFETQKRIVDMQYNALKDIQGVISDGYQYADTLVARIEPILRRGGIDA